MSLGHWDSVALMNLMLVMWYCLAISLLRKASFASVVMVVSCLVRTTSSMLPEEVLDEAVVVVVVSEDVVWDWVVVVVCCWLVVVVWDWVVLEEADEVVEEVLVGDGETEELALGEELVVLLDVPPPLIQPAATTLNTKSNITRAAALFLIAFHLIPVFSMYF